MARRAKSKAARRVAIQLLVAVAVLVAAPGLASAFTWSAPVAIGHDSQQFVSCPSATECVTADLAGYVAMFDPASPSAGTPALLDNTKLYDPTADSSNSIVGLACPSTSQCTIVDKDDREVTFNPASPGTPELMSINHTTELDYLPESDTNALADNLACPSSTECVTLDEASTAVTFTPGTGAVTATAALGQFYSSIACQSATVCTGANGSDESSFDPANGSSISSNEPVIANAGSGSGTALTCPPSAADCTLVTNTGVAVTFDPSTGSVAHSATIDASNALTGVACDSSSSCYAIDADGNIVGFDPAGAGTPHTTATGDVDLTDLACAGSASRCAAVDTEGQALPFNPASPGTPHAVLVERAGVSGLGVACASSSACVAATVDGEALSFNPGSPAGAVSSSLGPNVSVGALTCEPGGAACVATAKVSVGPDTGAFRTTFNPSSPATHPLVVTGPYGLGSLNCPSVSQCSGIVPDASVAGTGQTFDPQSTAAGTTNEVAPPKGGFETQLYSVGCASSSLCVASTSGGALSYDPQSTGPGQSVGTIDAGEGHVACPGAKLCVIAGEAGSRTFGLTDDAISTVSFASSPPVLTNAILSRTGSFDSISCPSISTCVVVDSGGDVGVFNPAAPGSVSFTSIDGTAPLLRVSCASAALCVATDFTGDVIVGSSAPVDQSPPTVSGLARVGRTLNGAAGAWSGQGAISYAYQWQACATTCTSVPGATGTALKLTSADVGKRLRFVVTARNLFGSTAAPSAQTAPVAALPSVSGVSLAGLAHRKPQLRFEAKAGRFAPAIISIVVSLPSGIRIKGSAKALSIKGATSTVRGSRLTIRFKKRVTSVRVTISSRVLSLSHGLEQKLKHHKLKHLTLNIALTDASRSTTKVTVKLKA